MHTDFRNMTCDQDSYQHAILETLEIFRIDLSQFVTRLSPKYVNMLIPPVPGVYMNASIHPFIHFANGEGYFSQKALAEAHTVPDILCFDDVWKHKGVLMNMQGRPVFNIIPGTRQCFTEYPVWHPAAVYIAYIYALESFRYLNPIAQPYSNVEAQLLDLRQHVRPEYLPYYNGTYEDYLQTRNVHHFYDEENDDLIELANKLKAFIGQNRYNVYRFYLNNTTMTIEKGNDFRVIEYYRMLMAHLAEM